MAARKSHRRPSSKPRASTAPAARPLAELSSFNREWWSSWQRANALGWDYLNAVSGLVRLNMNVFSRATRFPFDLAASNSR